VTNARGEGLNPAKTFFGLNLETQRDMVLLLVEEHRARHILETVGDAGEFDTSPGTGIAFQIDVEDAVGVAHQVASITPSLEKEEL
jgi:hypothetical protein